MGESLLHRSKVVQGLDHLSLDSSALKKSEGVVRLYQVLLQWVNVLQELFHLSLIVVALLVFTRFLILLHLVSMGSTPKYSLHGFLSIRLLIVPRYSLADLRKVSTDFFNVGSCRIFQNLV